MRLSNRAGTVATAAAVALFIAACGGSYNDGSGGDKGSSNGGADESSLKVNMAVAPGTLDPASGCGANDLALIGSLYSRLTQYGTKPGPDGTTEVDPSKIEPSAAESWDISEDGKTYTFKLRAGAKFPSGQPVDAEAVKYSFERALTMNGCGGYFLHDGLLDPPLIDEIEAKDATTVVFHLSQADPNALQAWAQPAASIVDKSVVEANGGVKKDSVNEYMASHAAGAGPYLLESYEPNKSAVLTANPDFAGEPKPVSKTIRVNFINSDPTLLLQAKSGDVDITLGLSKQSAKSLEGNAGTKVVAHDTPLSVQIGLPNSKKPFDNVKVREALALALPYEDILKNVALGYGRLFSGPLSPVFPEYDESIGGAPKTDPARAAQLIKESGIKTPVTVEMAIQDGNNADRQIATIAQGEWRKLGVEVKIRTLPAAEYITGIQEHKYQSYIRLDGPGVIDPGYFLGYDMLCDIGFNLSEVCIPEADKLAAEARNETDAEKRKALYQQISRLWLQDWPKIQVYADKNVTVLSDRVKNYSYSHEPDFRLWSK
ncbi:peptide/nickel transport system substrate-binding protein [Solirubrobacter pauli]|uniref:Peptide/nickel transport system substrate-binding protein n=1 Tax=Solirubrobacter pauli TaxID=166793 RepID=A0A660LCU8_9ACTN|nr:ABC transporter substrate-binding protein [Solirubrobacter pauli]RKQ92832.1 peptide/nickel transport system substrate-binding protein [Solirubrobacter pauli]